MKIKTSLTFVSSTYKLHTIKMNKNKKNNNNLHKRIQQKDNKTISTHPQNNNIHLQNNNIHSLKDWV